jgi:hypothetical protein
MSPRYEGKPNVLQRLALQLDAWLDEPGQRPGQPGAESA